MAHEVFKGTYQKIGLEGQVTTLPYKTYAKTVYQNSNNDLLVTQQALRHTNIQNTLCYLDTLADDVTQAMPNFGLCGALVLYKTSRSQNKNDLERGR